MNLQILFSLTFLVFHSECSLKKDTPAAGKEGKTLVPNLPNPRSDNPTSTNNNPSSTPATEVINNKNIVLQEQDSSSAESTPKVARHLLSEKTLKKLKMSMFKKPWFSSKISEAPVIRIIKKVEGKPDQIAKLGDVMRYAPRSLDTMGVGGLINYNNLERFYQPIGPTSANPNSLDHLFLPEFQAKDYMKPLEFNGLDKNNNYPGQDINNPYAGGYSYAPKPNDFRGNPIDINFPNDHDLGRLTNNQMRPTDLPDIRPSSGETPNGMRGEYPLLSTSMPPHGDKNFERNYPEQHQNGPHQGHGTPLPPPHRNGNNGDDSQRILNSPQRGEDDRPRYPDDPDRPLGIQNDKPSNERIPHPDFSNEVEGDGGLWGIVNLAHMLQNSGGIQNQLLNLGGGSAEGPGESQRHPNENNFQGSGQERKTSSHYDEFGHDGNVDHNYGGPGFEGDRREPHQNTRFDTRGGRKHSNYDKSGHGYKGGSGGNPNHFDKPIPEGNRGSGPYDNNNYDSYGGEPGRGSNDNRNRGQFHNNQYDGPPGEGGQGPRNTFRDDHHNNFPDDFPSESPDRFSHRPTPQSPSRRPQQYGHGGFDDEGSFYNSQEQFEGHRRPQNTNPDHDSDDNYDYK